MKLIERIDIDKVSFKDQKEILRSHHIKLDNVGVFGKFNLTFESPIHLANVETVIPQLIPEFK